MISTNHLHRIIKNSYLTALKSRKYDKTLILSVSLTKNIAYKISN